MEKNSVILGANQLLSTQNWWLLLKKSSECGDEELPLEEGGRERERASKRDRVILFNLLIEIADRFVLL